MLLKSQDSKEINRPQLVDKVLPHSPQLLKAVALRQRLRTTYEHNPSPAPPANPPPASGNTPAPQSTSDEPADRPDPGTAEERPKRAPKGRPEVDEQHEHSFPEEDQSYDSDTGVRKKRCPCGFVLSVEEM